LALFFRGHTVVKTGRRGLYHFTGCRSVSCGRTMYCAGRSDDEYRNKLKAVQQSLSEMTNTPPRESVLNSLLFYTRYEELDEYYCTNCNQGDLYS